MTQPRTLVASASHTYYLAILWVNGSRNLLRICCRFWNPIAILKAAGSFRATPILVGGQHVDDGKFTFSGLPNG